MSAVIDQKCSSLEGQIESLNVELSNLAREKDEANREKVQQIKRIQEEMATQMSMFEKEKRGLVKTNHQLDLVVADLKNKNTRLEAEICQLKAQLQLKGIELEERRKHSDQNMVSYCWFWSRFYFLIFIYSFFID